MLLAVFSNVCQWDVVCAELINHNSTSTITANRFFSARSPLAVDRSFLCYLKGSISSSITLRKRVCRIILLFVIRSVALLHTCLSALTLIRSSIGSLRNAQLSALDIYKGVIAFVVTALGQVFSLVVVHLI